MTFNGYLKQTKLAQIFKRWCEIRWKYFWCDHDYKIDKASLDLPMPDVYVCTKCGKMK